MLGRPLPREVADVIQDYVFDLADSIVFLQRKQAGYVCLLGHKNATVRSWEVFVSARRLAYQVAFWELATF